MSDMLLFFGVHTNMKLCLPSKKINYDWEHLLISYRRYVNRNSIVLEIGSSNIDRTKELSPYCKELIGIEIIPERKPNDFGNVRYLVGDWQNLSQCVQPESIDIAISSHVIEHVPDDLKAINELYVILKPGGVAILNTPNRKRLVRRVAEVFTGERIFPCGEHVREYIEEDLLNLLNASHFRKYHIIPLALGIHGGPIFVYFEEVPAYSRKIANFWEIQLFKEKGTKDSKNE